MNWIRVKEIPSARDCSKLSAILHATGIANRFTEEGSEQVLWVAEEASVPQASQITEQFLNGSLDDVELIERPQDSKPSFISGVPAAPLTMSLLFLSIVGFLLYQIGEQFIAPFTFWNIAEPMFIPDAWRDISTGEYWRIVTPVFLHFSILHIVFNGLWLWYLGSRIELVNGKMVFVVLVLVIAVISNSAQAIVSGPVVFGGMSGVVFGLLSFIWLSAKWNRHPLFALSPGLFPFMVGYMILSTTGVFDFLSSGGIADTAHISGFVTGLLCAIALMAIKFPPSNQQ